jgi:hypothetical protein
MHSTRGRAYNLRHARSLAAKLANAAAS